MSKLDLRSSYIRIRIAPGNELITAFRVNWSLFEYLVMTFGLTNSHTTYQRFINNILAEQIDRSVIVYLDNILIYFKNLATHKDDVRWILRKLQENEIAVAAERCKWNKTKQNSNSCDI